MDRIAVINTPEIICHGIAPLVLFFDKISIPDIKYVDYALEATNLEFELYDKEDPEKIGEQYLALGYYLSQFASPAENKHIFDVAEKYLKNIELLRRRSLVVDPFIDKNEIDDIEKLAHSAWFEFSQLNDNRIKCALSLKTHTPSEVSLLKPTKSSIQVAEIPNEFSKFDVIELIFKSLPLPSKDIPIDELLSFKNDGDVKADIVRFRTWITRMVKSHENLAEIEDEYIALYNSYKNSLERLSKQLSNTGLGIVMSVGANVLDNLTQLKLGSAVKSLFDYRTSRLQYDEKLKNLKGNELEYIRKLESLFS